MNILPKGYTQGAWIAGWTTGEHYKSFHMLFANTVHEKQYAHTYAACACTADGKRIYVVTDSGQPQQVKGFRALEAHAVFSRTFGKLPDDFCFRGTQDEKEIPVKWQQAANQTAGSAIALSADERSLFLGNARGHLSIWDTVTKTHRENYQLEDQNPVRSITQLSNALIAVTQSESEASLHYIDRETKKVSTLLQPTSCSAHSLSKDGQTLFLADGSTLKVWDIMTKQFTRTIDGVNKRGAITHLAHSDARQTLVALHHTKGSDTSGITFWSVEGQSDKPSAQISSQGWEGKIPVGIEISPNGEQAAIACLDQTLMLYCLSDHACLRIISPHIHDASSGLVRQDGLSSPSHVSLQFAFKGEAILLYTGKELRTTTFQDPKCIRSADD